MGINELENLRQQYSEVANERVHSLRIPEWLRILSYQPREFWSRTAVTLAVYQQLITQLTWERGVCEGVFGLLLCSSPFLSLCPIKLPVGTQTGKYLSLRKQKLWFRGGASQNSHTACPGEGW